MAAPDRRPRSLVCEAHFARVGGHQSIARLALRAQERGTDVPVSEAETTGPAPQDLGGETPQEPTGGETGKAARKPVRARKAAKGGAGEPAADAGEQADAVAGEGKPARAAAK